MVYDSHTCRPPAIAIHDHDMWWSCMIVYNHHWWSSQMIIKSDHHIWSDAFSRAPYSETHRRIWCAQIKCTMTFWPRFKFSKNDPGNRAKTKDVLTLRPAPSTELGGCSKRHGQISWGAHIWKVLTGRITAASKTPMSGDLTVLEWGRRLGTELPVGMGPGRGRGGDRVGNKGWGVWECPVKSLLNTITELH